MLQLGLGIGVTSGGGMASPPTGFAFLIDENGDFLVDENGDYLIAEVA